LLVLCAASLSDPKLTRGHITLERLKFQSSLFNNLGFVRLAILNGLAFVQQANLNQWIKDASPQSAHFSGV
jgi:hypothetical protein